MHFTLSESDDLVFKVLIIKLLAIPRPTTSCRSWDTWELYMGQSSRLYVYQNFMKLRTKLPRTIQEGYAEDQPVLVPSLCLTGAVRLAVIRAATAKSLMRR